MLEKSKFQFFEWSSQGVICGDPPGFELSNSESENIRGFLTLGTFWICLVDVEFVMDDVGVCYVTNKK